MSENRMETYFNIRYEFDRERVFRRMDEVLRSGGAGYICVADGQDVYKRQVHTCGIFLKLL